ncbi:Mesoderm-specific transcript protein [Acropora cervicornis]|uniref:Mesoderm-specific transcript protein n=1 Tax=Acropora cervicornis TaxID=6130 RepID=A0AAD9UY15_ACRCE|nr:Mesoderm-specific transcript protein [Acropora cervicornis]
MTVSNFQVICAVIVVAVAAFINFPAPYFSKTLQEWRNMGQYFNYRGNAIFYQDFRGYKADEESVVLCIHGFPTSNYDWSKGGWCVGVADVIQCHGHKFNNWFMDNVRLPSYGCAWEVSNHERVDRVWEPLKQNFGRVIASDMLGSGFSDKPHDGDYTVMEQATLQEAFLSYLGIHKLIANSWLGPVVARLTNYPLFARSLASVFGPLTRPTREELQDFWTIIRHKDGYLVTPSILQYMKQRIENRGRWVNNLQTTSVPVHLIYGPADPINPPQILSRYRELVVKGTYSSLNEQIGHYPQWEDPDGFMAAYQEFLSKVIIEK